MAEKTQIVITAKDETGVAFASAKRNLDSLKTAGSSLASTFSTLGVGGGIIGLIGGAGALSVVKQTIDELDALNLSAERLGVSASKLDTFNFAGKLAGLADDDIEKALAKISVKLEEAAAGSKTAVAWFDKLGVSWLDASGKVKTADKAFEDVADRISEMQDGTGKVTTLVEGFGDKLGRKLAPALNEGAKGFKALREEAEQLAGGSANLDRLAKQADEFNDNLDKLAFASKAAGRGIAEEFLPSLIDTSRAMIDLQKEGNTTLSILRGFAGIGKLPFDAMFSGITKDLKDLSVDGQVKGMEQKLAGLQAKLKDASQPGGLLGKLVYGKPEEIQREIDITKNQMAALVKFKEKLEFKPEAPEKPKTTGGSSDAPPKEKKTGGSSRAAADDAARLIAQLNEQIALKGIDAESTDKMTAAEQQRAKVLYQLDAGTLKASASQREKITSALDELVVLDRTLQAQKEYTAAVDQQEQANLKSRDAMLEQIAAAEKSAEIYGLTEAQISVVEQARLADAIAMARQNGASEEQIAFLEDELRLRGQLSDALIGVDRKRYESEDAKKAIEAVSELDEFTKSAAKNMQSAFADFLFDPFAEGADKMAQKFGQTVQRMLAEAASAQLMESLFGDYASGKKTGDNGLVGGLLKSAGSFDWGSLFSFADGGIMTSAGALPLNKYAMGGIANSPQLAMFGEGRTPEAFVPLPDGRRIPVSLQGGGGGQAITQNLHFHGAAEPAQVKRAAAAGYRSAAGAMATAGRYA